MKQPAIFNWSGGKDSALALYKVRQEGRYEVTSLLTTLSESPLAEGPRISMHGVRAALLDQQAASLGLPYRKLLLPEMPSMAAYEHLMAGALGELRNEGATVAVFGDIFLEDLRRYRETQLSAAGWQAAFPLWGAPTGELIREFLALGFQTITTCVNEKYLDRSFVGRILDEQFLRELPADVDPCGENGEFHTFVFDGPLFRQPIQFTKGEVRYRRYTPAPPTADAGTGPGGADRAGPDPFATGFWYCDLV